MSPNTSHRFTREHPMDTGPKAAHYTQVCHKTVYKIIDGLQLSLFQGLHIACFNWNTPHFHCLKKYISTSQGNETKYFPPCELNFIACLCQHFRGRAPFCFVIFRDKAQASRVLQVLNGKQLPQNAAVSCRRNIR